MLTLTRRLAVLLCVGLVSGSIAVVVPAGNAIGASCGVERWPVKTGSDADVGQVDSAATTTIGALSTLPPPTSYPQNNRLAPTETTVFSVDATLVGIKEEDDSDYHLVIQDATGGSMVTEIPDPACVDASSPFRPAIASARQYFDAHLTASTSFQNVDVPIKVRGVGFFDTEHGVTGAAPNGIELHPVLSIAVGAAAAASVGRTSGASRYDTAAAISAATFTPGVPVAFVSTGATFPDALAGGPAAATLGGPVLLVQPDQIPPATATELQRLSPGRIIVLGGSTAISDQVVAALAAYTSGTVSRESGATRYGTAAAISAATFSPGVAQVFIATGTGFPDALSGAAAAGFVHAPILLTTPAQLPDETKQELGRLHPGEITILGGTAAVSSAVQSQLNTYAPTVRRIAGADRFATSAAVAATFSHASTAYLATGYGFADALAGGPAAARASAPMLLVQQGCVPVSIGDELNTLAPGRITILGGTAAVASAVGSLAPCETVNLPPPPPPAGTLGCTASMSDPTPAQYSTVDVDVVTSPGAAVTATAHYKTTDTTHSGTPDANGNAAIAFNISGATIGYTVAVDVTVSSSGQTAACATSFTPQ